MSNYCADRGPQGFYCLLLAGHEEDHMSLNNRQLDDRGSPGTVVRWPHDLPRELTDELASTAEIDTDRQRSNAAQQRMTYLAKHQAATDKGYTGIPCDNCQSPNTVRVGKCLKCMSCFSAGECG